MKHGACGGFDRGATAWVGVPPLSRVLRAGVILGAGWWALGTALVVGAEGAGSGQEAAAGPATTRAAVAATSAAAASPEVVTAISSLSARDDVLPLVRTGVAPAVREKLFQSFGLALQKVRALGSCSVLFELMGTDGAERLQRTLYYPPSPEVSARRCAKGALAATEVGSGVTWLCPAFGSVSSQRAAMTLIHEALHFAGLRERPQVPGAQSSAEINTMVRGACGL
jgi:hypothetical protein